ncbi:MAG TPA: hypothetical protein PLE35_08135, partial [Lentisphaeria bacterium]|nr:hypothetical protein [Lentisphaeria bacterium]
RSAGVYTYRLRADPIFPLSGLVFSAFFAYNGPCLRPVSLIIPLIPPQSQEQRNEKTPALHPD